MPLPMECVEHVLQQLDPRYRFAVATDFRYAFMQARCLPLITTIDRLCANGYVQALDAWKSTECVKNYTHSALDEASKYGHMTVLQWWKESQLDIKWSIYAMIYASRYGHVAVLDWWKKNTTVFDDWWKNAELVTEWINMAIARGRTGGERSNWKPQPSQSRNRRKAVIAWWKNESGLPLAWDSGRARFMVV